MRPKAKKEQVLKATRDGFGEGLVLAARAHPKIVGLCADVTDSVRMSAFKKEFPERFVQLGVHEQLLAALGAGMALADKIPFIAAYAAFSPGRAWEQIRTNICINNANVKIVGSHAGLATGPDGATHQSLEDIATMRVLANMTVIVPADAVEARQATIAAAEHVGPVYLRLSRERSPVFTPADAAFKIGRARLLRDGRDCAIIACGPQVAAALEAAEELAEGGIDCLVLNSHTIKPLDEKAVTAAAAKCRAVVTVEDHQISGGLGSAVAEVLARKQPTPMEFVGVQDRYGESGSGQELWAAFGLDASAIKQAVLRAIKRK